MPSLEPVRPHTKEGARDRRRLGSTRVQSLVVVTVVFRKTKCQLKESDFKIICKMQ